MNTIGIIEPQGQHSQVIDLASKLLQSGIVLLTTSCLITQHHTLDPIFLHRAVTHNSIPLLPHPLVYIRLATNQ